ncbi:MAG TPA: hypothetical protein PLL80_02730 [Candidatus Pacearchaeota archaeon]|nr:hypothetical protein [Candidatus Pacearchaeota archaeon]HOK94140.1 hypothetical protein [Candidatus Pacearchaeota archaeon]HPO75498.1 hypothetical protein [Candidatus Pacearchaeota archaeon]
MPIDVNTFWQGIEQFSPLIRFLIAILVALVGWLVSDGIGQLVKTLLNKIKLNQALKRMGWEEAFAKAEIHLDASKFFGEVIKWCFIIIFLMIAFEIVGLPQFSEFLGRVVEYLPNIIIAGLIFIAAVFVADFSYRIVLVSAEKAKLSYSKFLGVGIRWTIWIVAILAILLQLGITPDIIRALIYGLIGMIALAGGLAFGLGGKDLAAEILKEFKEKIK